MGLVGDPILPTLRVLSTFHAVPRLRRQESSSSLQQYFQYDTLQQKLKCLEEENQKLRLEVQGDTRGAQRRSWWGGYGGLRAVVCPKSPLGGLVVLPLTLSLSILNPRPPTLPSRPASTRTRSTS